jgi:hypothetical protein
MIRQTTDGERLLTAVPAALTLSPWQREADEEGLNFQVVAKSYSMYAALLQRMTWSLS